MKKRFFILFSLVSAVLTAQNTEISIPDDFKEIKIYDKIQAELIPSTENKVVATGFDKDEIKAEVKNGVLRVKLSLDNLWSETDTKVRVYFKHAEIIDVNEGSSVEVQAEIKQDRLTLSAQEGASIVALIEVKSLEMKAYTGGRITARGKAKEQTIKVKAGGEIDAKDLITEETEVKISAGGTADVFATKYCRAKTTAGGSINVYGNPDKLDKKTSFGGSIHKR